MIRTTRWSPDTCDCLIEYTWDDTVPESSRVHTPARSIHLCPEHAALSTPPLHYAVLAEENPRKNELIDQLTAWAVANVPAWITTDAAGNTILDPARIRWYWDNGASPRVLHIVIAGISPGQRDTLTTLIASRPKLSGRVVVD